MNRIGWWKLQVKTKKQLNCHDYGVLLLMTANQIVHNLALDLEDMNKYRVLILPQILGKTIEMPMSNGK